MRSALIAKKENFFKTLKRVITPSINLSYDRLIISTLLQFLTSLIRIDGESLDQSNPKRSIKLTNQQMINILCWTQETDDESVHPLKVLQLKLDATPENDNDTVEDEGIDDGLKESLNTIIDYLTKDISTQILSENSNTSSSDTNMTTTMSNSSPLIEPILPQAEGIVTQYASRAFFVLSDGLDEKLNINYWMNPLRDETNDKDEENEIEQISCDLSEMIRICLPSETNITSECKRLLHLSASPQATRERTATAPCYRTRRVEVEPTTGRPEKKIFGKYLYSKVKVIAKS